MAPPDHNSPGQDLEIAEYDTKPVANHDDLKGFDYNGLSGEDNAFLTGFSEERRKATLRKVDVRLLPMLGLFYLFSFLDRANIGRCIGRFSHTGFSSRTIGLTTSAFGPNYRQCKDRGTTKGFEPFQCPIQHLSRHLLCPLCSPR